MITVSTNQVNELLDFFKNLEPVLNENEVTFTMAAKSAGMSVRNFRRVKTTPEKFTLYQVSKIIEAINHRSKAPY